jgi:hypothetical protein
MKDFSSEPKARTGRIGRSALTIAMVVGLFAACSGGDPEAPGEGGLTGTGGSNGGKGGSSSSSGGKGSNTSGGTLNLGGADGECKAAKSCEELGWECGYTINECGEVIDCADEGLGCGPNQVCVGGIDGPTKCVAGGANDCDVCSAIPDCSDESDVTRLSGRVVSPGRNDDDTANQVGVPNAIVYILRTTDADVLPAIPSGIPIDGERCDRCEDQDLGPVLTGAVTDASGRWVIEENVPVGKEFLLVVQAGKFRRATKLTVPKKGACKETELPTELPDNPTRLPRSMDDGIAVNLPRIAITTGQLDAMECVFEKMGIAHEEFSNPGDDGDAPARIHLYRGGKDAPGSGARIDSDTPHDSTLYSDLSRLQAYDMIVADCEGQSWDNEFEQRDDWGGNLREYVNRGGRLFASHLSFSWLKDNGTAEYSKDDPYATGLGPAASWANNIDSTTKSGTGVVSVGREQASPRIQNFADWMENEGVASPPDYEFSLIEPRSTNTGIGEASEEFVYRKGINGRIQQFSFNTPYGAPADATCGRVAYSGFHVSVGNASTAVFPNHCDGDLTDQEKVLLYMLFDLGACVGDDPPPPPPCVPETCESLGAACGFTLDGCGAVLDCGPCSVPK